MRRGQHTDDSLLPGTDVTSVHLSGADVELHAVTAGSPDDPLVVLLHGFPEFWFGWHAQIQPLVDAGFRVLVPDQRGYNLSEKPEGVGAYRLETLSRDVRALIEAAGEESAHVVGHDWGGGVAWDVALRYPEVVDRLAICNAPHPSVFRSHLRSDWRQIRKSWYVLFFQLPGVPEWSLGRNEYEALWAAMADQAEPGSFTPADRHAYHRAWSQPGALSAMLNWYRASFRYQDTPPRERVSQPTLVIWGEQDFALRSEMAHESVEHCRAGRLERFPNVGHWITHDRPDAVSRLLVDHVTDE
ncbi:alpha/beta fold hydrolase [Natrialbaceae archaeon A-CW3]